jgi:hypothetical protein
MSFYATFCCVDDCAALGLTPLLLLMPAAAVQPSKNATISAFVAAVSCFRSFTSALTLLATAAGEVAVLLLTQRLCQAA